MNKETNDNMFKAKVIVTVIKALLWIALIGVGIWYLSSSIGGGSVTYTSLDGFLRATGACSGATCDIAKSNACFLCPYIEQLFYTIGQAAYGFWTAIVDYIWFLLAVGFVIFLFVRTFKFIQEQNKKNATLDTTDRKFDFSEWFKPVWPKAVRILIVGVLIGVGGGIGGPRVLQTVADVTITPVMYIGSSLAMAATGVSDSAQCGGGAVDRKEDNVLGPALRPFMCVVGNLNTVMLAGAAGGFSLMNFSWMGMGGGMLTWIAGIALVIMFLIIGFNIFFKILSVVFQLVFLIIFLPLFIAAWAFEDEKWKLLDGVVSNAIGILAKCAVRIVSITLQILVVYAMVLFAADEYFPGPRDNYSAIMPAGIALNMTPTNGQRPTANDAQSASVMDVFSRCEVVGTENGTKPMDKDKFASCFKIQRAAVEQVHPGAFDFMDNGWEFLMMMIGIFLIYFYVIQDKIEEILGGKGMLGTGDTEFEFGKYVKEFGQSLWRGPQQLLDNIGKAFTAKNP
ncbi:MAG: hypothetical protein FWC51_03430 [Proteobacteria bacterium]|nr:hypothetical protein [Pseudomonadota bacterium]